MGSTVYFLPWNAAHDFPQWIAAIGAGNHIRERDFVALKIHFGEKGNHGYISPSIARAVAELALSRKAHPFLTDASTIYVGHRADAYHHLMIAHEHGFTIDACGCPVIIADGLRGNAGVDVEINQKHFKTVSIANAVHYADAAIFLSHFKGHEISGFGGALKNIGMGCGTRAGKYAMHDRVRPEVDLDRCLACGRCVEWCSANALSVKSGKIDIDRSQCVGCGECFLSCPRDVFHIPWDENIGSVQQKIVEYAFGALANKRHFSINFMNHITKYCDCYPDKGQPVIGDIGIAASADPVALDQACADIVNERFGGDFFRSIFPDIDWTVQLDYAEKIGVGTRAYTLVRQG
jgi:uncharacterized Fe-S center protein